MALGAWRVADAPPPVDRMADLMSDAPRERWTRIRQWFDSSYGLEGEPAWEGSETGWVLRYRRSGRPLATLMPSADGGFGALVVLGPSTWAAADEAALGATTRARLDAAKAYPDGKWVWLAVGDLEVADDLCTLVAVKSPPPRRPRPRAGVAPVP